MKHAITALLLLGMSVSASAWHKSGDHGSKRFERLDQDGDGLLTLEEFESRGILARMAEDTDGALTLEEAQAKVEARHKAKREWMAEHHQMMTERLAERFAAADVDADGSLTPEEIRQAAFARLDSNGDGYIDAEEAKAARKEMQHGKPGWRHGRRHGR